MLATVPSSGGSTKLIERLTFSGENRRILARVPTEALARRFLAALPPRLRDVAPPAAQLQRELSALCTRARTRWPGVAFDSEDFVGMLATRGGAQWSSLHVEDLHLAHACLRGDAPALTHFEGVLRRLARSLRQVAPTTELCDEVLQELRLQMLTGAAAKLSQYSGVGPLQQWLKVAALRIALRLRKRRLPADADASLSALVSDAPTPEAHLLRTRYRTAFRTACGAALKGLPPRDRNLLRLSFIDGVSQKKLAAQHRVDQGTVSRWLTAARTRLLEDTRDQLAEHLKLPRAEVDSILRMAREDLSFSLSLL